MADEKTETFKTTETRASHVEGAQSVADAVKRVADAAVAEVNKTGVASNKDQFGKDYDFPAVSGAAGSRVVIRGSGFGPGGSVHINGRVQAEVLSWSTQEIIARLPPSGLADGEIVVHVDDKVKKRGKFTAS